MQLEKWESSQTLFQLCLKPFRFGNHCSGLSQLHGCYLLFPCQLQLGWHPPYAQKQITILTMFQHVCFFFGLRVRIQHFHGGRLHSKHYINTLGKILRSKIKTRDLFDISFDEGPIAMGTKTQMKYHLNVLLVPKPKAPLIDCV